MTTLSASFLISLLLSTVPNAVDEAKLRHAGQELPEEVRNHPNNQDVCRVRIGQAVFGELVDILILDRPEDHAAIYATFEVNEANRNIIDQARTDAAVTAEELRSMRQQANELDRKMEVIPRPLWPMLLGPKEEIESLIARYNHVGVQLNIVSKAIVGLPQPVEAAGQEEEEEEAEPDFSAVEDAILAGLRIDNSPELKEALARAKESGGAIAVEVRNGAVTVLGEGSLEDMQAKVDQRNEELNNSDDDQVGALMGQNTGCKERMLKMVVPGTQQ